MKTLAEFNAKLDAQRVEIERLRAEVQKARRFLWHAVTEHQCTEAKSFFTRELFP